MAGNTTKKIARKGYVLVTPGLGVAANVGRLSTIANTAALGIATVGSIRDTFRDPDLSLKEKIKSTAKDPFAIGTAAQALGAGLQRASNPLAKIAGTALSGIGAVAFPVGMVQGAQESSKYTDEKIRQRGLESKIEKQYENEEDIDIEDLTNTIAKSGSSIKDPVTRSSYYLGEVRTNPQSATQAASNIVYEGLSQGALQSHPEVISDQIIDKRMDERITKKWRSPVTFAEARKKGQKSSGASVVPQGFGRGYFDY